MKPTIAQALAAAATFLQPVQGSVAMSGMLGVGVAAGAILSPEHSDAWVVGGIVTFLGLVLVLALRGAVAFESAQMSAKFNEALLKHEEREKLERERLADEAEATRIAGLSADRKEREEHEKRVKEIAKAFDEALGLNRRWKREIEDSIEKLRDAWANEKVRLTEQGARLETVEAMLSVKSLLDASMPSREESK